MFSWGVGWGSKKLDVSMEHFGQKSRKYENQECEKEKASTQIVQQNKLGKPSVDVKSSMFKAHMMLITSESNSVTLANRLTEGKL